MLSTHDSSLIEVILNLKLRFDLYFGPAAAKDKADRWVKTIPDKGWFVYFRIYGPEHRHSTAVGNQVISKRSTELNKTRI